VLIWVGEVNILHHLALSILLNYLGVLLGNSPSKIACHLTVLKVSLRVLALIQVCAFRLCERNCYVLSLMQRLESVCVLPVGPILSFVKATVCWGCPVIVEVPVHFFSRLLNLAELFPYLCFERWLRGIECGLKLVTRGVDLLYRTTMLNL
jgi:hypothetical protein